MIKIRRVKETDIKAMFDLSVPFWQQTDFHKESGIESRFEDVHSLVYFLMAHGIAHVAYDDDKVVGFILAAIGTVPFNSDESLATEIAFMVHPDYRKAGLGARLIKQAENVCRQQGIKYLNMINLESVEPELVESLYISEGYHKTETVFTKEV